MRNFLQDVLKSLIMHGFENLLHNNQKCLYFQRKIKPFQVILQVFGHISVLCRKDTITIIEDMEDMTVVIHHQDEQL